MNYRTELLIFRGALISKILLFGGKLISEWALIRSFMVLAVLKNWEKSVIMLHNHILMTSYENHHIAF